MGELFNKLNENQTKMMRYYIDHYAQHGDASGSGTSLEYLMREWDARKSEYLYKLLGENFVVEKEIAYAKEEGKLKDELDAALWNRDNDMYTFRKGFDAFLWTHRHDLGEDYWKVKDLMNLDQLATNVYSGETFQVNAPEDRIIKVQNGCRPVKLIGKIVNAYGELHDEYEAFRTVHSQILNQKMLKGTMCLSILPIDFMTMSDNDSDWSSCMSWKEDGCYCRGTVEMMNSKMVVVGYLKGSSDMYVCDNLSCSNKKWRELFIVTDEMIAGVKGYPYQNSAFVTECIKWLKDLAKTNLGWDFGESVAKFEHRHNFDYEGVNYKLTFETETMYNDFGSCDHYVSLRKDLEGGEHYTNYSGCEECMACGTLGGCYDSEGCLVCDDCSGGGIYCEDCGERIYNGDEYELDGRMYCRSCYDDHARECPVSHDYHDSDNFIGLYLAPYEGCTEWNKMAVIDVYQYADEYYSWERLFSHSIRRHRDEGCWTTRHYVLMDDINTGYMSRVRDMFELDEDEFDNYLSNFAPRPVEQTDGVQLNA